MKSRIVLILVIVAIVLGLVAGIVWHTRRNSSTRLLKRAELAMRAEKLDRAVQLGTAYSAQYPDDWRGFFLQARAHVRLGQYDKARELLEKLIAEEARLQTDVTAASIWLADTYSLPARRQLAQPETLNQTELLERIVKELRRGNEILLPLRPEDPTTVLDVQSGLGVNQSRIGRALLSAAEQYDREALTAQAAADKQMRSERTKRADAVRTEGKKALDEAIGTLLGVTVKDPSRREVAGLLVDLCIEQGDRESLQTAREAIMNADDPPPAAVMRLIMQELLEELDRPNTNVSFEQDQRDKVAHAAKRLDELISADPDEVFLKLQRAKLALMLRDLSTVDGLVKEILKENPRHSEARLLEARLLLANGDVMAAQSKLFRLAAELRGWPDALYYHGEAAMAAGKKDLALQAMRRVTELQPKDIRARRFLAQSLLAGGFYDQAFVDAQVYHQESPEDPLAVRMYAESALHTDQPDLARRILQEAEKEYASDPRVLMAAASVYAMLGDQAEAARVTQLAADCDAITVVGRLTVARAMSRVGRVREAEALLAKELSLNPNHPQVNHALGEVYSNTGKGFQALQRYREAVRLDSTNDQYRVDLGRTLLSLGELDECIEALEPVDATNTQANLLRFRIKLIRGEQTTAEQTLEQANPEDVRAVALAYLRSGKLEQCRDVCQAELAKTADNADVRMLLAQACLRLGERDQAIQLYNRLIKDAPRQLSYYLQLVQVLSADSSFEEAVAKLKSVPGVSEDIATLAVGRLLEHQGRSDDALTTYHQLANKATADSDVQTSARVWMARVLGTQGRHEQAIAELELLDPTAMSAKRLGLLKVSLFVAAGRTTQAASLLAQLHELARESSDLLLLRQIAEFYIRIKQPDQALAVCQTAEQLMPYDSAPHLLRASVLMAIGETTKAIDSYRKAIACQPSRLDVYKKLALALDEQGRPTEAMAALDEMAAIGPTGKSAALFERGIMFNRWGLTAQAVRCFEALADSGHADNPKVQMFLGKMFADLGLRDRAVEVLAQVPEYAADYLRAQRLLAHLTRDTDKKLLLLDQLQKDNPMAIAVLIQRLDALLEVDRPDDALEALRAFIDDMPKSSALPSQLRASLLETIFNAKDQPAAVALSVKIARLNRQRWYLQLAVLLTADTQPDTAVSLIPEIDKSGLYDAAMGLYSCCRDGNERIAQQWSDRIFWLDEQMRNLPRPQRVSPAYKALAHVALGNSAAAQAMLDDGSAIDSIETAAVADFVKHAVATGDRTEALSLVKVMVARDLGITALVRRWALDVLRQRPSCQWAAVLLGSIPPDEDFLKEVLQVIEPKDSALAQTMKAQLLMQQDEFDKAVDIYSQLAKHPQASSGIHLSHGLALENAGRLAEAKNVYRSLWMTDRNPIAANNAAYIVTLLSPDNPEKLRAASEWAKAATEASPAAAFAETRGWITFLLGEKESALTQLRQAGRKMTDSPEAHYHIGLAEAAAGSTQLANWHLAAAVELGQKQADEGRKVTQAVKNAIEKAKKALADLKESDEK